MKRLFFIFIILFIFTGLASGEYKRISWDASTLPDALNTPPVPVIGYVVYQQDTLNGSIEEFQTTDTFFLLSGMTMENNKKYKLWVKSYVDFRFKSGRSNEVYFDSRMPVPPKNGRIVE